MNDNRAINPIGLVPSTTKTATYTGPGVDIRNIRADDIVVVLDVTAASGTTPTLDVYIQGSYDGVNWTDIGHFTQVTAAGRRYLSIKPRQDTATTTATEDWAEQVRNLAAGSVRNIAAPCLIRADAVIGGTTPSFTFAVSAVVRP